MSFWNQCCAACWNITDLVLETAESSSDEPPKRGRRKRTHSDSTISSTQPSKRQKQDSEDGEPVAPSKNTTSTSEVSNTGEINPSDPTHATPSTSLVVRNREINPSDPSTYTDESGNTFHANLSAEQRIKYRRHDFVLRYADLSSQKSKLLAQSLLCLKTPNDLSVWQAERIPQPQRDNIVLYAGPERYFAETPIYPTMTLPDHVKELNASPQPEVLKGHHLQGITIFLAGHHKYGASTLRAIIWYYDGIVVDHMGPNVNLVIAGYWLTAAFLTQMDKHMTAVINEEQFAQDLWDTISQGFDYLSYRGPYDSMREHVKSTLFKKEASHRQIEEDASTALTPAARTVIDLKDLPLAYKAAEKMLPEVEEAERQRQQEFVVDVMARAKVAELAQQANVNNEKMYYAKLRQVELEKGIDFESRNRQAEEDEAEVQRLQKEKRELKAAAKQKKSALQDLKTMEQKRAEHESIDKKERLDAIAEERQLAANAIRQQALLHDAAHRHSHDEWVAKRDKLNKRIMTHASITTSLHSLALPSGVDIIQELKNRIAAKELKIEQYRKLFNDPDYDVSSELADIKLYTEQLDMIIAGQVAASVNGDESADTAPSRGKKTQTAAKKTQAPVTKTRKVATKTQKSAKATGRALKTKTARKSRIAPPDSSTEEDEDDDMGE